MQNTQQSLQNIDSDQNLEEVKACLTDITPSRYGNNQKFYIKTMPTLFLILIILERGFEMNSETRVNELPNSEWGIC